MPAPDAFAAALARAQQTVIDALRGPADPRALMASEDPLVRLTAAALCSDGPALEKEIAASGRSAAFLADWAGFWAFGAQWHGSASPAPAEPDWLDDWAWIQRRRSSVQQERRDAAGKVALLATDGPMMVEMDVNGVLGVAVIDTGAASSVLTPAFAERAGLVSTNETRTGYDGAGISGKLRCVVAPAVRLGSWSGQNLSFETLDFAIAADGILSPFDLFGRAAITFDLPAKRLIVGPDAPPGGIVCPVFWSEGTPSIPVGIEGQHALALIDSGAGGTVLTLDTARRAGLTGARVFQSATALGSVGIRALGEGNIAITDLPLFRDRFYGKDRPPARNHPLPRLVDAYLGTPWFACHRVHFPAVRGMIHIWPMIGEAA